MNSVYACTVCGACYEKCKQVTTVELGAPDLFETMQHELATKGWLLGAHKTIADRIKETENAYGEQYEYKAESTDDKADVFYYIGCNARYRVPEIADAMLGIFNKLSMKYQVMDEGWCCGSGGFTLWSATERLKEAKEAGAEALVSACLFCKRNLKEAAEKERMEVYDVVELVNRGLAR